MTIQETQSPLKDLMIAIPTKGDIHANLALLLTRWALAGAAMMISSHLLIDHARNQIVKAFLKTDKKWLLMIDADVIPDVLGPETLIKHNKDIISGFYRLIQRDGSEGEGKAMAMSNAYGVPEGSTGLHECQRLATGYLLINRTVFSKIPEPWFEIIWTNKEHTEFITEDYSFSDKAKEAGYVLYEDLDVKSKHAKTILLE